MHEDLEKELSKQTALAQNGQSAIDTNMRLSEVIVDLQSCYKEAMELLEAAIESLKCQCNYCKYKGGNCKHCVFGTDGKWKIYWKWQHADRYEALKAKENEGDTL